MVVALVAVLAPVLGARVAEASVRDSFDVVFGAEDNGAIALIGSTSMDCPSTASGCAAARTGSAAGAANNNNAYNMVFVDVDGDSSTSNSSTATLAMPSGSTVLYARLVWGGRTVAGSNGVAPTKPVGTAKFRAPGGAYTTLDAQTLIQPSALAGADGGPYQAAVDVTAQVKAAGNGVYAVADIGAATGVDRYAGWSLVVAYRNAALPTRSLRVFEGFADVSTSSASNSNVDLPVAGFLTPPVGQVNASVGVVAWEGDLGTTGDALKLGSTTLSDATRPAANFFDSRVSDGGVDQAGRTPNQLNNFGVDVGRIGTVNVLPNGSTATTINLTSTGDAYYPGIVTSQIDLFTPQFNSVSKTVVNLNGNDPAQPGDVLEYRLAFTNSGSDFADSSTIRDALPAGVDYVPGSLVVDTDSGGSTGPKTDAAGDDSSDYTAADRTVRFRVGSGATATAGGTVAPSASIAARFRATVTRAASGTTITNTPALDYRARTINRTFTFTGNDVTTPVRALADLAATKTASTPSQNAGQTLTYTISAVNQGPNAATGVTLTDTLPAGLSFESATTPAGVTCTPSGQVVTCQLGSVPNGATVSVPIVARIGADSGDGVVTNSVRVAASTADDVAANNTATASTTVTRTSDLKVSSAFTTSPVVPGGQATMTATVTNAGPSLARDVALSTTLPAGTTLVSATGCTGASGTVSCEVGSLAPGASFTTTIVLAVASSYTGATLAATSSTVSSTPEGNPADNTATASAPASPLADLRAAITAADQAPAAGNRTNFTVTISNPGPSDARDVVAALPAVVGVRVVSAAPTTGTCAVTADAVSCPLGTIPAGSSTVVALRVELAQDRPAGALVETVNATTSTRQDDTTNDTASVSVSSTRVSDLNVTTTAEPGTVIAGQPLVYTLVVTNRGPSTADGTTLSDVFPAGLTPTSVVTGQGSCTLGQTVSCSLGTLAPGASTTVTIRANTPGTVPSGGFTTTATATSASTDPVPADNTATHVANVTAQADLSVTKTASAAEVVAGRAVTYDIAVTNNGPSTALGASLVETLADGLVAGTVTTSAGSCAVFGGEVRCTLGDLAGGATARVSIEVRVPSGRASTPATSSTSVTSPTPDPSAANNTTSVTTAVRAIADARITGVDDPGPFVAGERFTRSVTVDNAGPSDARDVVVTADLPDGVLDLAASVGGTACAVSGGRVSCPVGTLASGQSVRIDATGRISSASPPGPRSFSLTLGSSTPDPDTSNNSATRTTSVTARAGIVAESSVDTSPLVAGARATYRVKTTNNGPSDAVDVVITDVVPDTLAIISAAGSLASCTVTNGRDLRCTIARLPAGASDEVTLVVVVSPTASGTVENTARVTSATPTPGGEVVTTTSTAVVQSADLRLTGTATPEPVRAGAAVVLTFTATNVGPSSASAARFSATLPDGLTLLPGGVETQLGTCTPTPSGKGVQCDFGTLEPGRAVSVVLTASVPADTPAGTELITSAAVGSSTPDPTPEPPTTVRSTVTTEADVAAEAHFSTGTAVAGGPSQHTITITNNGTSVARDVVVVESLPPGVLVLEAPPACIPADGQLTCTLGDLDRGEIVTLTIVLQLPPDYDGPTFGASAVVTTSTSDPNADNNTATASQGVTANADLRATAVIVSGPVVAGTPTTFRLGAVNDGPSQARDVILTIPAPADSTYAFATPSADGTCVFEGGSARCTWPVVAAGATVTADVVFVPASGLPAGSTFAATVTASASVADPDGSDNTATASGQVGATADVSAQTLLTSGAPVAGGSATWQVVVGNDGPSSAYGVVVDDPAPAGLRWQSAQGSLGTCTVAPDRVRCAVGTIPAGGSAIVTVTGVLADDYAGTSVTNTATVTTDSTDPDLSDNTSSAVSDTTSSADLRLDVVAAPDLVVPGAPVTWTFTATNGGPSLSREVVVTADLPAGTTPRPTPGCVITGQRVRCVVGDLAPGASAAVAVSGLLAAGFGDTRLVLTGSVAAGTSDPTTVNNTATSSTAVQPSADLSVDVIAPPPVTSGGPASWTVRVRDGGPSDAGGVQVTLAIPAYLAGARATWPGGTCSTTVATATCALGGIPAGETVEITLTGTVEPGYAGDLTVGAEVTAQTADPVTTDNTDSATTPATRSADLATTLSGPATAVPGRRLTWTATTVNGGLSIASAAVLTQELPEGLSEVTATTPAGTCGVNGRTVTCQLGDLAPSASAVVTTTAVLAASTTAPNVISSATATSPTFDPNPGNNTADTTATVAPAANLQVSKAITSGPPIAGAPVTFVVDVSNAGPSDAQSVVLTDTIPTTIGAIAASTPRGTCAVTGATVRCELGTVAAGAAPVEVTVTGVIADGVTDPITNTASATSPTTELDPVDNSGSVTASATESADLSLTVDSPATVTAGQGVAYTITVANDGPSTARAVQLTGALPDGLVDLTADNPGCTSPTVCDLGDIAPGASVVLRISGTVRPDFAGSALDARASAASAAPDPDGRDNSVVSRVEVTTSAAVAVALVVDPDPAVPGRTALHTATATNTGPSTARQVVVSLPLPTGTEVLGDITADQGTCRVVGRTVVCELGDVAPGAAPAVRVPVGLSPSFLGDSLVSTASVQSATADPDAADNTATTTTGVGRLADLFADLTGPATVVPGTRVTWETVVRDFGPSDAPAELVQDLPEGVGEVSAQTTQGSCTVEDRRVRCSLATLGSGATATVRVSGVLAADSTATTLTSTVTLNSPVAEPDPAQQPDGRSDSATSEVTPVAGVAVEIIPDAASVTPGLPASWTVVALNRGPSTARGVVVTATAPTGTTGATLTGPTGVTCGADLRCTIGDLAPGAGGAVRLTLRATIDPGFTGPVVSAVVITAADTQDPNPGDNTATASTVVRPSADLGVQLATSPDPVLAGGPVTFTATVRNAGPSNAADVRFTLPIPAGVEDVQVEVPPSFTCDATAACTAAALPVGEVRIVVRGRLTPAYTDADLTATASIGAATPDPDPTNNSATDTTAAGVSADVSAAIALDPTAPVAGSPITITATVANNGPSTATGVRLSAPVPSGVEGVTVTGPPGVTCDASAACDVGTLLPGAEAVLVVRGTVSAGFTGTLTATAVVSATSPDDLPDNNSASASAPVGRSADLSAVTKVEPTPLVAGGAFAATTTIRNDGPSTAAGATFALPVPDGVVDVAVTAPAGITCDTTVSCALGDIAPGASFDVVVRGTVAPSFTGAEIAVTSTVSSPVTDPDPADNTSSPTTPAVVAADVRVGLAVDPGQLVAGSPFTASATVRNDGPSTATGVALSLPVPAGVEGVEVTAPGGTTCDQTIACTIGTLYPTAEVVVVLRGRVAADYTGPAIAFTASTTATSPDPLPDNNSTTVTTPVGADAGLGIGVEVEQPTLTPGTPVTVKVTARNSGPSTAAGTTAGIPVPAGLLDPVFTAPPGVTCALDGSCTIGAVAPGAEVVITLTGRLDPSYSGPNLTVTATVASGTPDADPADNTASATRPVVPVADLGVRVTLAPDAPVAGSPVEITAVVVNRGPSTATGVAVDVPVPAGVRDVTVTAPVGVTCTDAVRCTVDSLLPDGELVVVLRGVLAPDASDQLRATATVSATTTDPVPGDNTAEDVAGIGASAALAVTAEAVPNPAVAGTELATTVTVRNNGPSTAAGTRLSVPVPTGLLDVRIEAPAGVTCDQAVECTIDSLAPTGEVVVVVRGTVDPAFTGSLTLRPAVTAPVPDPDPTDNAVEITVPVQTRADLRVGVVIGPTDLVAGSSATIRATVANLGPSTATGGTLDLPIPTGLTQVTVIAPPGVVCDPGFRCTLGTLQPNQEVVVEVRGTVAADLTGELTANATAASPNDPVAGNDTATTTAAVRAEADVRVTAALNSTDLVAGAPFTATTTIDNAGPSTAAGLTVMVAIPAGAEGIEVIAPPGSTCDSSVRCTLPPLAPGTNATVTVRGVVSAGFTGTSLQFPITATAATADPDTADNATTLNATVRSSADLTVAAVVDPVNVNAGTPVTITATVRNTGPSNAADATLTLPAPTGVGQLTYTGPAGVTCGSDGSCTLGTLAPGAELVITLRAVVAPDFTGDRLDFTATSASPTADPLPDNNSATASAQVDASADVAITLAVDPTALSAGTPFTATATIRNGGTSTALGTRFTLPIPAGVVGVAVTGPPGSSCDATAACTLPALDPGAEVVATVRGTVSPDFTGGSLAFTAAAQATTPDPDTANNTAAVLAGVNAAADLSTSTTVDPGTLTAGAPFTATTVIRNSGPATAAGISFTLPVPAGARDVVVEAPPGVTCDSTISCTAGLLAPGTELRIVVRAALAAEVTAPTVAFTATATSTTADPTPNNNTSTLSAPVAVAADLTAAVAVEPAQLTAGSPAEVRVTVRNTGPSTAVGATLTVPVPAGFTGVEVTAPAGVTCDNSVSCALGTTQPGAELVFVVRGTVAPDAAAASLTFTATATSPSNDPDPADNTATIIAPLASSADLVVALDVPALTAGAPFTATASVRNTGPSTARQVRLDIPVPAGATDVEVVAPPGVTCDNTVSCAIGAVPPDGVVTIVVRGRVAPSTVGGLAFSAAASSPVTDPDPTDNAVSALVPVATSADLVASGAITPSAPTAGSPVTVVARLRNDGPSTAVGTTLTATLPPGLIGVVVVPPIGALCDTNGDNTTASCTIGSLDPGGEAVFEVRATVPPTFTGPFTATITAEAATTDPDPADNTDTLSSPVGATADLSLALAADPATAAAGRPLAITATIRSAGPSTATGARVSLPVPAGLRDVEVVAPAGVTCSTAVVCELGDLAPGSTVVVVLRGTVDPAYTGTLATAAELTSATGDPNPADNSAALSTPVDVRAELSVTGVVDPVPPVAGSETAVNLEVRNTGPATAARARLLLAHGLRDVTVVAPPGVTCDDTVACDLGDLPPDAVVRIVVRGTVPADLTGALTARAGVESATADPVPANDVVDLTTAVATAADIAVAVGGPASASAGEQVTWQLTARNDGPSQARDVVLLDALPAGVEFVSADQPCALTGTTVRCALGTLEPGASRVLSVVGRIAPSFAGAQLVNTATTSSSVTDPDQADNTAQATTAVGRSADVSVTNSLAPDPVVPGGEAVFTLVAANAGPSSAAVTLTDVIGAGQRVLAVVSTTGTCTTSGQLVTCDLGVLAPGASATVTIRVGIAADFVPDTLSNTATVAADAADPDPADNTASVAGTAAARSDLVITNVPDRTSARPGETITWQVTADNRGPSTARDAVVTLAASAGVTLGALPSGCQAVDGRVVCRLGDLAPGGSTPLVFTGVVNPDATAAAATTTATVVSTSAEVTPADNTATASTTLAAAAALSITKTADGPVVPGRDTTWTLDVANAGPSLARGVVVTDALPTGTRLTASTGGTCAVVDSTVRCTLADLPPAGSARVTLITAVDPALQGDTLANTAAVASGTPDTNPADNAATATPAVTRRSALAVAKTADTPNPTVGDTLTWTITTTNEGPSQAPDATVTDRIPAGVTLLSAEPSQGTFTATTGAWTLGPVAPGTAPTLTLKARLDTPGALTNQATLSAATDSTGDDNTAAVTVTVADQDAPPTTTPPTTTPPSSTQPTSTPPTSGAPGSDPGTSAPEPENPPAAQPPLSHTGFAVVPWLSAAALLLLVGAALIRLSGRRRS
ncbi:DUF11 domain-containing protein [Actinokineospora bangkokensis]|uniref:DUF11 domain-containing protein n=1 Tax=Actinokineospora bangkokensis TaxID=1193682 RepID=A0A1Q9LME9_9PSEU|nr:DUF11 domain-containing protein [Actinokineospora bangkokensis]OLR93185.1 hypothetical protein BJP25_16950 [Actinokineospora bangkokensis]